MYDDVCRIWIQFFFWETWITESPCITHTNIYSVLFWRVSHWCLVTSDIRGPFSVFEAQTSARIPSVQVIDTECTSSEFLLISQQSVEYSGIIDDQNRWGFFLHEDFSCSTEAKGEPLLRLAVTAQCMRVTGSLLICNSSDSTTKSILPRDGCKPRIQRDGWIPWHGSASARDITERKQDARHWEGLLWNTSNQQCLRHKRFCTCSAHLLHIIFWGSWRFKIV